MNIISVTFILDACKVSYSKKANVYCQSE